MNNSLNREVPRFPSDTDLLPPEQVKEVLVRILNSKHFSHAPKKRKFVQMVCEYYLAGRADELNEYLIGREVYERNDQYTPTEDPVVRVGAHDVRKRLEQYYQHEGLHDEIHLEIPLGSYEPIFRRVSPLETVREAATVSSSAPAVAGEIATGTKKTKRWIWAVSALLVLAALVLGAMRFLAPWLFTADTPASAEDQQIYASVWNPFLKNEDPTILVLSNPAVYVLVNSDEPKVTKDTALQLSEEQAQKLADALKAAYEKLPDYPKPPRLHLSPTDYTGMGEAIGVNRLTELFRGQGHSLNLKQSRNLTAEDLKDRNLIMLGGRLSNVWSGKLTGNEDFYFTPQVTLANRNPHPGEQAEYRTKFDDQTGRIVEDYALITVKPAAHRKNTIMTLEGIRGASTGGAAEAVTNKSYLREINRLLQQMPGTQYYQVLLKVGIENQVLTTISVLSVHAIKVAEN
jgi:hypothetical protein